MCGLFLLSSMMMMTCNDDDHQLPQAMMNDDDVTLFTLVSSNSTFYYEQTLLLYRSIDTFMKGYPLHLLVTDDVDPAIIDRLKTEHYMIPHIIQPYPNEPTKPNVNDTWITVLHASWIHQLSKIKLWSFVDVSKVICYLDSDYVFFGGTTLQSVIADCIENGFKKNKQWCGFDGEDVNGNNSHWEMSTIEASFFCLQPNMALFERMERELVYPFTHGQLLYKGKYVATEQDLLNLFFNGQIHYVKRPSRFFHGSWNALRWFGLDMGFKALTGC